MTTNYSFFKIKAPEQRSIIAFGMKAYHDNTCIRFVPRTCEKNYITIFKSGGGYENINYLDVFSFLKYPI